MEAGEEIAGSFLIAGRGGSELLDKLEETFDRKRQAEAVQPNVLKFQGMSASISLFGHRLAMRSRVSVAQA
jgi:hypothetical protein